MNNQPILDEQTVIAADLDGTLAESKLPINEAMATAMSQWLTTRRFAIISGGSFKQISSQILPMLPAETHLEHLFFYPINGATCYEFKKGADGHDEWEQSYELTLSEDERKNIVSAFDKVLTDPEIHVFFENLSLENEAWGEQIEYRGGQITFSALGQRAPLDKKAVWDADQQKRKLIVSKLEPLLSDFHVSIGGTTSIDITPKGIDKAYAIEKMKENLQIDNDHIIFFGDALFEGGNDWPATRTGVTCIKVADPEATLAEIQKLQA
jgi:HAD superfamily hydrolase (TIGR01484 family)